MTKEITLSILLKSKTREEFFQYYDYFAQYNGVYIGIEYGWILTWTLFDISDSELTLILLKTGATITQRK